MTTAIMATAIASWIWMIRHRPRIGAKGIAAIWDEARWYEKAALLLFFVPIPGPLDEILAATVALRVARRLGWDR